MKEVRRNQGKIVVTQLGKQIKLFYLTTPHPLEESFINSPLGAGGQTF